MMNPLTWLAVGGLLGWLASRELGSGMPQGIVMNIVAGVCGALFAGWLLAAPALPDLVRSGEFSLGGLCAASLGAIVLLAVVNLIRLSRNP
jgi:uncharacterized membrane protein YeaQ/YmgE (transglycosylase-associated protein family)